MCSLRSMKIRMKAIENISADYPTNHSCGVSSNTNRSHVENYRNEEEVGRKYSTFLKYSTPSEKLIVFLIFILHMSLLPTTYNVNSNDSQICLWFVEKNPSSLMFYSTQLSDCMYIFLFICLLSRVRFQKLSVIIGCTHIHVLVP